MKTLKTLIYIFILVFSVLADARVSVRGYYRKNGTYVAPHYRSSPDHSFSNNWSTKGNINPYTGKVGTKIYPHILESYPSNLHTSHYISDSSSTQRDTTSNAEIDELKKEINSLKHELSALDSENSLLKEKLENIKEINSDQELLQSQDQLIEKFQVIKAPLPSYSREERRRGLQGICAFAFEVDINGKPFNFKLIESSGHRELDKKSLQSLKLWRFKPGKTGNHTKSFKWEIRGLDKNEYGSLRRNSALFEQK